MATLPQLVEAPPNPIKKVLFLGYSREQTVLIDGLIRAGCEVWHTQEKFESVRGYDFAVSCGYRHIIESRLIRCSPVPIINLHISYLPWNRGAHPNFWSFFDCTPSGVSIHLIDEGIDTGPILYQRYVNFPKELRTFTQTYWRLRREIEDLFMENIDEIVMGKYEPAPQRRRGSYHRAADLPVQFAGWDCDIQAEIRRLDSLVEDRS